MISRYTTPQMQKLWSDQNRYQRWLEVELLSCEAWAQLGVIPGEAVVQLRERCRVDVSRIEAIEAEVKHDVIAFVTAVAETAGEPGRYLHYGLTSYDVVDTALSSLMREAAGLIIEALYELAGVVAHMARQHKRTLMVGRTHGVHAEPITLGLKFALWYAEILRDIERLSRARDGISYGKLSGAVGTYAHVDPRVEVFVCQRLGLTPAPLSTQILQRDRHAEYLSALAITATSIEKFATEIRSLQRTEILELEEPFSAGQKGSSAMPHKRNPVGCEQMSGLARLVRANAGVALENMVLWNERDISNSSAERVIIPGSTTLVHYMVRRFCGIVRRLQVYPENMLKNLNCTGGLIYSQQVLLALVASGLSREEAYAVVQELAMKGWRGEGVFADLVRQDPRITSRLDNAVLEACFDPWRQLEHIDTVYGRLGL
ncbi:MAG: adenylosuccinate lyase [Bacillota bacterium]